MTLRTLLKDVNSWNDFKNVLESKSKLEKGKAFEELTKYYLQYNPVYKSQLKNVWLHSEIIPSILKKLNIPSNDQGIDIVAETFEGKYWAIQCKYLQDEDQRLSHRAISTFVSLSTGIAENITYCLVCTTVDDYAKIYQGKENIGFCNSDEWRKLDKVFFEWVRNKIAGKENKLIPYTPKEHQIEALKEARQYFTNENNSRGKLVFPCGAGKSLTGYWITKELKANSIIVAVPSLSLVKQTLEVYLRETVANSDNVEWLCVCSDQGIGKNDDVVIHTNEIGVPCITNKTVIADWLIKNQKKKTIIFTTYQSGKAIAEACKIAKHSFNLGIMDEAHKTVGEQDKLFSHLLFEKNINIEKRIFMTATERRYAGSSDTILSMDDVNVYGETFAQMSFKQAIEIGILSDYKIITLLISNQEVKKLIEKNAFVKPTGKDWDKETEARTLASLIALRKAMTNYPIHHAVTFHSSIKKAEAFEQSQTMFSQAFPKFTNVQSFHVSGAMPTSIRGKIVDEFAATEKGIITNAKCLTEGVDVPNIDCVLFADPRKSTVDIVQAVGRALRKTEGKEFGYVILPVFTESNNKEEIINSDSFKEILSTIRALASNDERIIEYFRDISKGTKKRNTDSLIEFDIDELIAEAINENELIDELQLSTWNKLAKLSWMAFEEAREFVRGLKLKSRKEYNALCRTNKRPADLPIKPDRIYRNNRWISWGNFLGTDFIALYNREYLPYEDVKRFAERNGVKTQKDWFILSKTIDFPKNIPAAIDVVYKNQGWRDWFYFLNKENPNEFVKYEQSKSMAQKKEFTTRNAWQEFARKNRRFPSNPDKTYKNNGWISWDDFFGVNRTFGRKRNFVSYAEAKQFAVQLNLKKASDWIEYCKKNELPFNIPAGVHNIYKKIGWVSWGDFLGTQVIADKNKVFLEYEDAKKYVSGLGLKSVKEWRVLCSLKKIPNNIPKNPESKYKGIGWKGWSDFLSNTNINYWEFDITRKFAQSLKIVTSKEWNELLKKPDSPKEIPHSVSSYYKNKGWNGWGDFLGNKLNSGTKKHFRSYRDAEIFIRTLKLNSAKEWIDYINSGKKPMDIPSNPGRTYKNKGWVDWGSFLGSGSTSKNNKTYLSLKEAKAFVAKLGLKSLKEWQVYSKTIRPLIIPSNPAKVYRNLGWKGWQDFLGKK